MPRGYVPALDGWRGVSILLVLASHASGLRAIPGGLGVTVFFFVSGLLITGQLLDEVERRGNIDLARFYWRRVLRLLPASTVYVLVAGCIFVAWGGSVPPGAWLAALFYGANYAEIASRLFETDIAGVPHPFVILWSLAIEEHFYLLWPALVLATSRARSRWLLVAVLVGCILLPLIWRVHLETLCGHGHGGLCGPHGDSWIGKSTDTRADSLGWGALAAVALRSRLREGFSRLLGLSAVRAGGAGLLILTLVARDEGFRETVRFTLQGGALLVLVTGSVVPGMIGSVLSSPVLVTIGRLSYGLYLWHWLALMIVARLDLRGVPGGGAFVALTAGLTLLSWCLIERPAIRLRRRAGSHATDRLLPDGMSIRALDRRAPVVG